MDLHIRRSMTKTCHHLARLSRVWGGGGVNCNFLMQHVFYSNKTTAYHYFYNKFIKTVTNLIVHFQKLSLSLSLSLPPSLTRTHKHARAHTYTHTYSKDCPSLGAAITDCSLWKRTGRLGVRPVADTPTQTARAQSSGMTVAAALTGRQLKHTKPRSLLIPGCVCCCMKPIHFHTHLFALPASCSVSPQKPHQLTDLKYNYVFKNRDKQQLKITKSHKAGSERS